MRRAVLIAALLGTLGACAGCGGGGGAGKGATATEPLPARGHVRFAIPGVASGGTVPQRYTCDGQGSSPPLRWSRLPDGTRSLVILVTDPDAPGGPFFHWSAYDLRPSPGRLEAGELPAGARQGENSRGDDAWTPPCPPEGDSPHRYIFELWAESAPIGLPQGASREALVSAARKHRLGFGSFGLRYGR